MMKSASRQTIIQAVILSFLIGGPLYYSDLREKMRSTTHSNDMFDRALRVLVTNNVVQRIAESKKVLYSIKEQAVDSNKNLFQVANTLVTLQQLAPLTIVMDYLVESLIFDNEETAVQAAVAYWALKYQEFSVRSVAYCSLLEGMDQIDVRKLVQNQEERYFSAIENLKKKYPDFTKKALEVILVRMQIILPLNYNATSLASEIEFFLKKCYPETYDSKSNSEKDSVYFDLRRIERDFKHVLEQFFCKKKSANFQRWVCKDCKMFKPQKEGKICRYYQTLTRLEKSDH